MAGIRQSGEYRIDAREFSELLNAAKEFEKGLGLRLRKNIRDAAKPIVKDMRDAVTSPTSKRSASIRVTKRKRGQDVEVQTHTAALVAKGIRFRVGTGKTGGTGAFVSSSSALPAERKAMARALNKKSFRHPVFGDSNHWVTQTGRPYFGSVILGNTDALYQAIEKALDEAATALGRTRIR